MKKLMKAIAFATVMCMLLSTATFAAVNEPTLVDNYKLTVTVTASEDEQVALLVLKEGTALSAASESTIYYVNQDAAVEGTATFNVVLNSETLGAEKKVDIYAGYASNVGNAVSVTGVDVVEEQELAIVLDGPITVIPDAANDPEYEGVAIAQSDKGGLVYANVKFENYNGEAITNVGWEFANGSDKRYIHYAVSGYNVLNGAIQLGVAFTNGSEDRASFVTTDTDVSLWFKVGNKALQAVAK